MNYPAQTKLAINQSAAIEHLQAIGYQDGDMVYLRAIPGKGYGGPTRKGKCVFPHLPWETLNQFQAEGKGIYFVVNSGGDTDDAVTECTRLFFEHDDLAKNLQIGLWKELGLPQPTAQVETRKSIHTYWVIEPISPDQWRDLQSRLLDYADADRTLKNPSRVMRLAGSWHVKADEEPIECRLIQSNPGNVPLNQIERLIRPQPAPAQSELVYSDAIPLQNCLTIDDRALIAQGQAEGGRNAAGAKLARNLIATQQYLQLMGHRYDGSDRQLFDDFCRRCSPPLAEKEAEGIWRSAQKGQPKPSLTAEAIENCVRAWHRQQSQPVPSYESSQDKQQADDWHLFRAAIAKLVNIADPCERTFRLRQICNSYKMPLAMGQEMIESQQGRIRQFAPIDVIEFMSSKQGDREWLLAAHLPLGAVINLCAMGGTGKTSLAYEWVKAVSTGTDWNSFPVIQAKTLIIQSDEPETDAQEKLDIQQFYDLNQDQCFIYFNWTTAQLEQLEQFVRVKKIRLIVIDSLAAINLGMDRDRSEFADSLRRLRNIASDLNCTFLVLDHTNKSGGNLGTVAVHNAVSEMIYLKFPTEDERRQHIQDDANTYRILSWEKSRSGMQGTKFLLRQNPADYTNEHLGELKFFSSRTADQTTEMLSFINTYSAVAPLTIPTFAAAFDIDFRSASGRLEMWRRTGLIGGQWVTPKQGEHAGKRWRVYHSLHPPTPPPEEIPETIEYEYTLEDEDYSQF
jgi:hypothetical protein